MAVSRLERAFSSWIKRSAFVVRFSPDVLSAASAIAGFSSNCQVWSSLFTSVQGPRGIPQALHRDEPGRAGLSGNVECLFAKEMRDNRENGGAGSKRHRSVTN